MSAEQPTNRVAELRRKLLAKRWDLDEVRDRLRAIRARALVEVAEARDVAGKPLYPSERVRDAAVTVATSDDEDYKALRSQARELAADVEELAMQLTELLPPEERFPFRGPAL